MNARYARIAAAMADGESAVAFLALASLLGVAVPVAFWWSGDHEAREFPVPDFVIAHFVVCQLPFLLSWWMAKLARSWRVAVWGAASALAVLLLVYLVVFLSVRTDPLAGLLLLPLPYVNLMIVFPLGVFFGMRAESRRSVQS